MKIRKLKYALIFLVSIILTAFIVISVMEWLKALNNEYLYHNKKTFKRKLATLPSGLNSESIKRIKSSINPEKFKFVVLGDSESKYKVYSKVLKDALLHKPDFILSLGDFTEQGKVRHYVRELEFIKKNIPVPYIAVIGNHDYHNYGYRTFTHIFGPLDFYFDVGKFRFICLDSNFKQKINNIVNLPETSFVWDTEKGIDDDMMIKLENLLISGPGSNLIFMHHPPPIGKWAKRAFEKNSKEFLNLIEKEETNVKYVSSGHYHGYGRMIKGDITFLVSGGAGGRQREKVDEDVMRKYNYVLFEINGENIKETVYFVKGGEEEK